MDMGSKKLSYQEVAETMSGLFVDVQAISDKFSAVMNRVNELPEPSNVKEEAVFQVMMNTTEIMIGSLDHILQICLMYEKSKYVVRKNKI